MELLNIHEFQLIKKDFSVLRQDLFEENGINDWDKIIIIYNFYLLINYVYYTYNAHTRAFVFIHCTCSVHTSTYIY